MKKSIILILIFVMLSMVSCGKRNSYMNKKNNPVLQVLQDQPFVSVIPTDEIEIEMASIPTQVELQELSKDVKSPTSIDIDLKGKNYNMVAGELFNIVVSPEEYKDKSIRMEGYFAVYVNNITKEKYYSVIIPDESMCCQQGLEFVWVGNHSYPNDYPKIGQKISVTGIFSNITTKTGLDFAFLQATDLEKL